MVELLKQPVSSPIHFAKQSIASFKLRQGDKIGIVTTLRGDKMYGFLDKLINVAIPRMRDFRGLNRKGIDEMGNYTIGIKEHTIFPETADEDIRDVFGLSATLVCTAKNKKEGIAFFTDNNFSQQLGYMNRPEGYIIAPHRHNLIAREVMLTQETLFIKSGKIRVDFYDNGQNYLESRVVSKGDIVLLATGGHGFKMLEPSEIVEVKQGPYAGERDKVRFNQVEESDVKLK